MAILLFRRDKSSLLRAGDCLLKRVLPRSQNNSKENTLFPRFSAQSAFIAAFCCALPALAQTAATAPATSLATSQNPIALDELIARALKNNPQPQIAAANLEAARARANSARAQIGPTLQIVPAIGGNQNSRDEELILSQPIDLFGGRRANRAVFDARLRGAQSQSDSAVRVLVLAVKNAASESFAAQEAEALGEVQLDIARQFRDAAARRAELGEVPAVQTQRAQLDLDRAAIELDAARAQRAIRRVRLNQLIGAPPQEPLTVALPQASFGNIAPLTATPNSEIPTETLPLEGVNPNPEIVPNSSQIGADLVGARAALLPGALQRPDILLAQSVVDLSRAQVDAIAAQRRPQHAAPPAPGC